MYTEEAKMAQYYNEVSKRAAEKYVTEKCRKITMVLNKVNDEDILVWLDSLENKQGYLKALIRADMAAQGFTPEKENK